MKSTYIEIGARQWNIQRYNRKGSLLSEESICVPADILWDAEAMSELLPADFSKNCGRLYIILNISDTKVKLLASDDGIPSHFAKGFVTSRAGLWFTAVAEEIPRAIVEMCRINKIPLNRIMNIDTLEYCIATYYSKHLNDKLLWIFLSQEPGIRLIVVELGKVKACFYFSNDPEFRLKEVSRIWMSLKECLPDTVLVYPSDKPTLGWLSDFIIKQGTDIEMPVPVSYRDLATMS